MLRDRDTQRETDTHRQRKINPRPNTFLSRAEAFHTCLREWILGYKSTVLSLLQSLTKYFSVCYVYRLLCKQMGEMLRVQKRSYK